MATKSLLTTLTSDGNATVTGLPTPAASSDAATKDYVDQHVGGASKLLIATDFLGNGPFNQSASGSGASTGYSQFLTNGGDHQTAPGVVACTTGTTASGAAYQYGEGLRLGGGAWRFRARVGVDTLSNGTQQYAVQVGILDNFAGSLGVDGCWFRYDSNSSANWKAYTGSNSTWTSTDTSVAVTTAWQWLQIDVNAGGTSVDFRVGATAAACASASPTTITTNIPTGSGRNSALAFGILKTAGTTARLLYVDYLDVAHTLTTAR